MATRAANAAATWRWWAVAIAAAAAAAVVALGARAGARARERYAELARPDCAAGVGVVACDAIRGTCGDVCACGAR